ncbi:hypothetical protein D9M72_423150 [compost metagenome]
MVEAGFLSFPAGIQCGQRFLFVRHVRPQRGEAFNGGGVLLVGKGKFLHGQPVHLAAQLVDLLRCGIDLHAQP